MAVKEISTLEEDILTEVIDNLRRKIGLLQEYVDKEGLSLLRTLYITSLTSAQEATEYYTNTWFKKCLYSDDLKIKIAQRLIEQTKTYPVDNSIWLSIVAPKQEEVNTDVDY